MQQLPLHLPRQRASKKQLFNHPNTLNSTNSSPTRSISEAKLANSELNTTSIIFTPHEKENVGSSLRLLLEANHHNNRAETSSIAGIPPSSNTSLVDDSSLSDPFKTYKGKKHYLKDRFAVENRPLNVKHSKLDLLDDTKLTSFPLPHPQPNYHIYSNTNNDESKHSANPDDQSFTDDLSDLDSESVNDFHQLVLIEDYVAEPKTIKKKSSQRKSGHKVSVLDLKRALINEENQQKRDQVLDFDDSNQYDFPIHTQKSFSNLLTLKTTCSSVPIPQSAQSGVPSIATSIATTSTTCTSATTNLASTIGTTRSLRKRLEEVNALTSLMSQKRSISDNSEMDQESGKNTIHGSSASQYSSEAYLDSILNKDSRTKSNGALSMNNATSSLKYCIMCEKPLYDISSLIPMEKKFEEIICSDCFEDYERISNALSVIPEEELAIQLCSIEDTFQELLDSQEYLSDNEYEEDYNTTIVVDNFSIENSDLLPQIIPTLDPNFSTLATKSQRSVDDSIHFTDNLVDRLKKIQRQDAQMANNLALSTTKNNKQNKFDIKTLFMNSLHFKNHNLLIKTYRTVRLIRRLIFGD